MNISIHIKVENKKEYAGTFEIPDDKRTVEYIRQQGIGIIDMAIRTLRRKRLITPVLDDEE